MYMYANISLEVLDIAVEQTISMQYFMVAILSLSALLENVCSHCRQQQQAKCRE